MTEQHSSSPAASTSGTRVEHEQTNERIDDNSNPQQGASSSRNSSSHNINECPTSNKPEQDLNAAVNNVPASTPAHSQLPHESNTTGGVGSSITILNPPAYPRQSLKIPPSHKDDRKLFVGGLPADITDEEFRLFFEQYGEVIDSIVMIDYETNRSRGFGFVTFSDPNVARYLLSRGHDDDDSSNIPPELQEQARASMSGRVQMHDKWIEIKAAEPKAGNGGGMGGRSRYGSGSPSRGGGAVVGRNRNAVNTAPFSMRNQHGGNYKHRTPPFIPPQPSDGQAILTVGDPYSIPEYGANPSAISYPGTATNQPPVPHYPQYYGQHLPQAAAVYAHPYYYPPAHVMPAGVHAYSHHHAAGFGDQTVVTQAPHAIPEVDPSCPAAVPMMNEEMDHVGATEDATTHPATVYPVGFGYSPYMMPANSSYGVTIVPVPPPPHHPSPMPIIQQQSVMQYVAPGIPGLSSSSKDAENDSTDASLLYGTNERLHQ